MATRAWAAATAALNPPLLTRRSCSRTTSFSPARRSAATGLRLRSRRRRPAKFECRRAKNAGYEDYKFPDPIPEFAEQVSLSVLPPVGLEHCLILPQRSLSDARPFLFQETSKFREHMAWRLDQKKDDYFGEHVEEIVDICTQACICPRSLFLPPHGSWMSASGSWSWICTNSFGICNCIIIGENLL